MKVSTGIIIFFLSLLALVAEIFLYFIMGIGAAFSGGGGIKSVGYIAMFFVSLFIFTIAVGILSPLCALIELLAKKKNLAYWVLLPSLGVVLVFLLVFVVFGATAMKDIKTGHQPLTSETTSTGPDATPEAPKTNPLQDYAQNHVEVRGVYVASTSRVGRAVFGEIKNKGDKALEEVQIIIYFLDKEGNPVYEKDYRPVLVSDFSFSPEVDSPLKPGYSRKFGVKADDAPSDWGGKVRVEIGKIRFLEEE